jgi:hypothetical protein
MCAFPRFEWGIRRSHALTLKLHTMASFAARASAPLPAPAPPGKSFAVDTALAGREVWLIKVPVRARVLLHA